MIKNEQNSLKRQVEVNRRQKERVEEMTSDTQYIDWLEKFTLKRPFFSEEDWQFSADFSQEDRDNIQDLPLFYRGIDCYARRNYISPSVEGNRVSYPLKKDDVYYQIGYQMEQERLFYCERVKPVERSINFYSIMSGNLPMRTMYVDQKLAELSHEIGELMSLLEVPSEFIEDMVSNAEWEHKAQKSFVKKR